MINNKIIDKNEMDKIVVFNALIKYGLTGDQARELFKRLGL